MRNLKVVPILAASACIAAAACASAPRNSDTNTTRTRMYDPSQASLLDVDLRQRDVRESVQVNLTAVQAFDALPAAYARLGVPSVAVVDTSGGTYTIGASAMQLHGSIGGVRLSKYIDCGSNPMHTPADSYIVSLSVTSYVKPAGNGASINTMVRADARDPAANTPPVRCVSTGLFERNLAAALAP